MWCIKNEFNQLTRQHEILNELYSQSCKKDGYVHECSEDKSNYCKTCDRQFSTKSALNLHMKTRKHLTKQAIVNSKKHSSLCLCIDCVYVDETRRQNLPSDSDSDSD